ncbi:hypothetical protein [Sphingosinicella sp.]|uniref:hypothetical protein n=1 Tax=Sphingosinicella sp. TaxID=1917971 RepID=UPI0040379867
MSKRRSSLTGSWSGAYRYAFGHETVFNAQIEEVGGAFVGATQEPNEFLDSTTSVLNAEIEGVRNGSAVTFTKFYNHEGIRHAVRYDGTVDESLLRIEGKWTIRKDTSGTFFMTRDDDGEAAETEERADAEIRK